MKYSSLITVTILNIPILETPTISSCTCVTENGRLWKNIVFWYTVLYDKHIAFVIQIPATCTQITMDANNIVVAVAIASASISVVTISLVLIVTAIIIARSKSGGLVCMNMLYRTSGWRLKWQTNGDAITVYGQKPMLDNSIEKDRIA